MKFIYWQLAYQNLDIRPSHLLRFGTKIWSPPKNMPKTGVIILTTQTMHSQGEIPQNYHSFALFDSPQIGNLMIPVKRPFHLSRFFFWMSKG